MTVFTRELTLRTTGPGTYEFTDQVAGILAASSIREGLTNIFCRHTSCSLVLMENADPSARHDLETYLNRLVPQRASGYTHTAEGPDDMPSHIKMALTRTSETVPVSDHRLQFGTWQGIFLWEHRNHRHNRKILISIVGE